MDTDRTIDLEHRLINIQQTSPIDIYAPPRPGVRCECDSKDGYHFHVRCMSASCDKCGKSFTQDFLAYTRDQGYIALAQYARKNGWNVNESANYYLCPDCA